MNSYTLVHNGMDITYHDNLESVNAYINTCLSAYANLQPKKILDSVCDGKHIIVYQYYTLYCEMFMIVKEK